VNILYYDWNEFTREDAQNAFVSMGHTLTIVQYEWKHIGYDEGFLRALLRKLLKKKPNGSPMIDFAFSFNFFPVISIACEMVNIPYLCLVFDSPYLPLNSIQINNSVNHVFVFDQELIARLRRQGVKTLHHSPLAVSGERLKKISKDLKDKPYYYDISFVGTLYDDEFKLYDSLHDLQPHVKRRVDEVIRAQERIYGYDLIGQKKLITDDMILEMQKLVDFEDTGHFFMDEKQILRDMIRRKVSQLERVEILQMLAEVAPVSLFTREDQIAPEGVNDHGYAEYRHKMPEIFRLSKVNLNITLRTILSGIPLRALDVMAAGGFLISTYQRELAEAFEDGKELILVHTPKELKECCSYYLAHEAERDRIRRRGQEKVLAIYDYKNIFEKMIQESIAENRERM
jgi:hypothetical protein